MEKDYQLSRKYKLAISKDTPGLFEKELKEGAKKFQKSLLFKDLPSINTKPKSAMANSFKQDELENIIKTNKYTTVANILNSNPLDIY